MPRDNSPFDITQTRTWQISPDLLSVIDIHTARFTRVNPAWTVVLGFERDEIEGMFYEDFVHPDDLAPSHDVWVNLQHGLPIPHFINRYRHKGGGYRWLSWSCVPDDTMLYSRCLDVTADKERDAELAKTIRERDNAWRLSQDLLLVMSLAGQIESVNERWADLLGWQQADLLGKSVYDFMSATQVAAAMASAASVARKPLSQPAERAMRQRNGSYRWFGWTARREGDSIYASGRDLTVERNQADALRHSRKMESVGQLTGGLAHDFNNLLTGVLGSLELIQMRLSQGRVTEVDRYTRAAQGAALRAASLTQRLLTFAHRQQLAPVPTDVNRLVSGMEELIRRAIGPEIEMRVVSGIGLWPALVDPSELENALLNLVISARDAMPKGGCVTIETANRWLDEHSARTQDMPAGQFLSISVSDTGGGMPADLAARMPETGGGSDQTDERCTGLGLPMVYEFAKVSRGHARLYTEPGIGTTMCLYLPRHVGMMEEPAGLPTETLLPPGSSNKTVLVVEDEPSVRMLLAEVLDDLGYVCFEACDSGTGMRMLGSERKFDLLVSDIGIPGKLNGRQMAEAARQSRPDLPVLLITGYAEKEVIGDGLPDWMTLLTKPFTVEMISRCIRKIVETE